MNRMLRILGLFELQRPIITAEWLISELGDSRASIYRDLAQLAQAGLIERIAGRGYALGPRIIEMDRQIRLADHLLVAAKGLIQTLSQETGGTVLLCRRHSSTIVCIDQVPCQDARFSVSYERGRPMPLYRGATSKVVLAHLSPAQLRQLWAAEQKKLVLAGLPDDFAQLAQVLAGIRSAGYCITEGEVDPQAVGFAVPLRDGDKVLGSLSTVVPVDGLTPARRKIALGRLQSAAGRIEGRLQDQRLHSKGPGAALQAR